MYVRGLAVAMLVALGCGDDGGDDLSLEGEWIQVSEDGVCARGAVFDAPDFEFQYICELEGGGYGTEVRTGTYTRDGSRVALRLKRSSCSGDAPASEMRFEIEGGQLTLADNGSAVIYDPLEDTEGPSGGTTLTTGCWTGDSFSPQPLEAVP